MKKTTTSSPSNIISDHFRYERKFFIEQISLLRLQTIIKFHPHCFTPLFPFRYINNIYFDTFQLDSYYNNVNGDMSRAKVRIRWYGDLWGHIESPVLEIKTKEGTIGHKESYPLPSMVLTPSTIPSQLKKCLNSQTLPDYRFLQLNQLIPTLINRYGRYYFKSTLHPFRLTLDSYLSYYNPVSQSKLAFNDLPPFMIKSEFLQILQIIL